MRIAKALGMAIASVLATMALIGPSAATAEPTALCTVHETPCASGNLVTTIEWVAENPKILLSFSEIECEELKLTWKLLGLGAPQIAHVTGLTIANCKEKGSGCGLGSGPGGSFELLKTALNLASAKSSGLWIILSCQPNVVCKYGGQSAAFHISGANEGNNGTLVGEKTQVEVTGTAYCPLLAYWDIEYIATEAFYVVS
jgi:hypothetical protein